MSVWVTGVPVGLKRLILHTDLEAFKATEFNEMLTGRWQRRNVKVPLHFRDWQLPRLQGIAVGLIEPWWSEGGQFLKFRKNLRISTRLLAREHFIFVRRWTVFLPEDGQEFWPKHVAAVSNNKYKHYAIILRGPGSVVGIATTYGLDGPGIESWWGRNFRHLSRPALRTTQLPIKWVPRLFRG
jgi:hypothetical protein